MSSRSHLCPKYGSVLSSTALFLLPCLLLPMQTQAQAEKGSTAPISANLVNFVDLATGGGFAGPLTHIYVGDDNSFQIKYDGISATRHQLFPSTQASPADAGVFVRVGGVLYTPDFNSSGRTSAAKNHLTVTPLTSRTISGVTGSGTAQDPYRVAITGIAGASGLNLSHFVDYRNGEKLIRHTMTFTNKSAGSITFNAYLAADLYVAASDNGTPFHLPYNTTFTGAVGGVHCEPNTNYRMFLVSHTPLPKGSFDHFSATNYPSIWQQIQAGNLNDLVTAGCPDNAAGLQWTRTVLPGNSVTITAISSFGGVDLPGLSPWAGLALVTMLTACGWVVLARNRRQDVAI